MDASPNSPGVVAQAIELWRQRKLIWRMWKLRKVMRARADEAFLKKWLEIGGEENE